MHYRFASKTLTFKIHIFSFFILKNKDIISAILHIVSLFLLYLPSIVPFYSEGLNRPALMFNYILYNLCLQEMNHQQLTEENDESDDCDSGNDEPSDLVLFEGLSG